MPRKAATPASAAKKGHKRQLSAQEAPNTPNAITPGTDTPGTRTSKRIKDSASSTPATGKKSKYFDGPDSDDSAAEEPESPADDASASGYEDEDEDMDVVEDGDDDEEDSEEEYDSDEDEKPKKRGQVRKGGAAGKVVFGKQSAQMWREGVKVCVWDAFFWYC